MSWVAGLLAAPFVVVTVGLLLEVVAGARPARRRSVADGAPTAAVLIPAHDEGSGIGVTLDRLLALLPPGTRVLVVADNCSDDTAAVAASRGVEVIERHDPSRRGKGYALAFGRERLSQLPPACVIVLDADTVPTAADLDRLSALAVDRDRPVQCAYLLDPPTDAPPVVRFSAAAFFVKNMVRQLGATRLGAPALLTGSGMAFPWPIFARLPLATGHVAEDLMLGVESTIEGKPPLFCGDVVVVGGASSAAGTTSQRRRWESGTREVASAYTGALVRAAIRRRRPGMLWTVLQLWTPPLVPLLALDALGIVVLAMLGALGAGWWPFAALLVATALLVVAVPVAIVRHGRGALVTGWRSIPRYAAWKVRLTLSVLLRREREWIRTERD